MNEVVAIFLVAPLVVVPLGYRLLEVAAPGYAPPAVTRLGMILAGALLALSFLFPTGLRRPVRDPVARPDRRDRGRRRRPAPSLARRCCDPGRPTRSSRRWPSSPRAPPSPSRTGSGSSRSGSRPTSSPLTMVHFHFAGFALPLAGALAFTRRPQRWLEVATGAVIVGIPTTALGFFGFAAANWIGAVLTAIGGLGIGLATIAIARSLATRPADGPGDPRRCQPARVDAARDRLRHPDADRRRPG